MKSVPKKVETIDTTPSSNSRTATVDEQKGLLSRPSKLTPAECAVIVGMDILEKAGRLTTPREIADLLMEDVQTVRNILERLKKKGLVVSSLTFGMTGLARMGSLSRKPSGREKVYRLVDNIENIIDEHNELLEWALVTLGVKGKDKLLEYIKSRAEEIARQQEEGKESQG